MQTLLTSLHFSLPPSTSSITPHFPLLQNFNKQNQPIFQTSTIVKHKPITSNALAKSAILFFNFQLQLYVSSGAMREAQALFDSMPERSVVSWTILMSGYAKHGPASFALVLFRNMLMGCSHVVMLRPDAFVFAVVIRACGEVEDFDYGREVHGQLVKRSEVNDSFVENALIDMYMSCGCVGDAEDVFDRIDKCDLVAWSSMLNGYVKNGLEEEGLWLFRDMVYNEIELDAFSFSMVIVACARLSSLEFGIQVHCLILKLSFGSSLFLENSLLDFYAKCGDVIGLRQVFSQMSQKELVSWNTLIAGYVDNFHYVEALLAFQVLMNEESYCDEFTLTSVLRAVSILGDIDKGTEIHGYIMRVGLEANEFVISALLDMYIECIEHKSLDERENIPLKLLYNLEGWKYDEFILASCLKWSSLQSNFETGKQFHSLAIKLDVRSDPFVVSSLIDMYSKGGIIEAALRIFQRVENPGTTPWSALISGCMLHGRIKEAMKLFQKMQSDGIGANEFTITSALLACLALEDLRMVRELHCRILRSGYGSKISVVNTLINTYSELWHHKEAVKLCNLIPCGDKWNLLIQACLRAGDHEMIHKLLREIQKSCGHLDIASASRILSSCSDPLHVNVARQAHGYMTKRGFISESHPTMTRSLISMYSGCGKMADAVLSFNTSADKFPSSWGSIICARVDHGLPYEALEMFVQMQRKNKPADSSTFAAVLRACAQLGLVDEAYRLFTLMEEVHRIEPSEEHYSSMVEVLGRAGMFEDIEDFINGVEPTRLGALTWWALISSCRLHGNMKVAKYAVEKLLELNPSDSSADLLLKQIFLALGKWDDAAKLKTKSKPMKASSSWIEVQSSIYEFVSNECAPCKVSAKLSEIEGKMEELGYVADKNHLLHNAEEEENGGVSLHHTEMKALAFGILSLPHGMPVQVVKSVRMCGDCHSACKFMSNFLERELVVKDPCCFHHFRDGKCSCRDAW
ncbi:Pentatricopeptide repeat [Dillenia turbinata]|uniref:Pentatricopeptide repeat n=1 Tax=Dillenia turbinata TaxID=194707 RepID=A0AAN8VLE0_9MAGN